MKWYPSVPLEELKGWDRKFSDVVFAVGNFDGVHLGHCALLDAARAKAEWVRELLEITGEDHP